MGRHFMVWMGLGLQGLSPTAYVEGTEMEKAIEQHRKGTFSIV